MAAELQKRSRYAANPVARLATWVCQGDPVSIEIDLRSLKRHWSLPGGHLEFVVRADFDGVEPDLDTIRDIAAGIRHGLGKEGANPADVEGWVLTDSGWAADMHGAFTLDDGLEWLERFAATWGDFARGTIKGGPHSQEPGHAGTPQLTAYAAYTTGDLAAVPSDDRDRLWYVEDTITGHLAHQSVNWAYVRACTAYLQRDDTTIRGAGEGIELAISEAISRYIGTTYTCEVTKPLRQKMIGFWPHGKVAYHVVDPTTDWIAKIGELRKVLAWTPPHTDLVMLRHAPYATGTWSSPSVPWPYISESQLDYNRPLLTTFVPDASGIQLLTDSHLKRANDLSNWKVKPLNGGRYIVEAQDLEPWFADTDPEPALLAKARAEFGDMILTPELIRAHRPFTDGPQP